MLEEKILKTAESDQWLKEHPPKLEWWSGQYNSARINLNHPIVETLNNAYFDIMGSNTSVKGVTYGADMRLLVNEGNIPTVLFRPGDVRYAHKPDEFVPVSELITSVRTLTLTALRFCGY